MGSTRTLSPLSKKDPERAAVAWPMSNQLLMATPSQRLAWRPQDPASGELRLLHTCEGDGASLGRERRVPADGRGLCGAVLSSLTMSRSPHQDLLGRPRGSNAARRPSFGARRGRGSLLQNRHVKGAGVLLEWRLRVA